MKRALQYLLLSLLLVGCSPTDMDYKLSEIESLMDSSPELALSALDSIAPTQLKHDSQKALFALLYSQALDKNYIDETNDSLIRVAVRHFDKSDDLYHKMLSHYYHGRVYYNAKDFPRSLSSMTKAYNASEDKPTIIGKAVSPSKLPIFTMQIFMAKTPYSTLISLLKTSKNLAANHT